MLNWLMIPIFNQGGRYCKNLIESFIWYEIREICKRYIFFLESKVGKLIWTILADIRLSQSYVCSYDQSQDVA